MEQTFRIKSSLFLDVVDRGRRVGDDFGYNSNNRNSRKRSDSYNEPPYDESIELGSRQLNNRDINEPRHRRDMDDRGNHDMDDRDRHSSSRGINLFISTTVKIANYIRNFLIAVLRSYR